MRPDKVYDYSRTGERDGWNTDEWWCPTSEEWTMCPGPCPDGTPHGPKRTVRTEGDLFVSASTGWRRLENASEIVIAEGPQPPNEEK